MSGKSTTKMLEVYEQNRRPAMFMSSLFRSPRENFYNSESIQMDIQRSEEKVAVAVTSLSAGYNYNKLEVYTNKAFTPPIFKQAFQLNSVDLINRVAGQDPFQNVDYMSNMMKQFGRGMALVEDMINRAVELQVSQVMQTGTATLKDADGNSVFTIDYSPKATHFFTVGTAWDGTNPTIIANLEQLMDVIRDDGKGAPTYSLWGIDALNAALADAPFLALYNKDSATRADLTRLTSDGTDSAKFRGSVDIGHYPLEIWTFGDKYEDVETGVLTPYMDPAKVMIMVPGARMDLTWGNAPIAIPASQRIPQLLSLLPARVRRAGTNGVDMIPNVWTTVDGEHIFGGITSRPLAIPTAIDRFGCLDSGV